MNIAFTGPRSGMTVKVLNLIFAAFDDLPPQKEIKFFHGACVGADEHFHRALVAYLLDHHTRKGLWSLEIYPSDQPKYVANLLCTQMGIPITIHPPMPPLKRNVVMARECHVLWAAPINWIRMRSGTWYTIHQVERLVKPIEYFVDDK